MVADKNLDLECQLIKNFGQSTQAKESEVQSLKSLKSWRFKGTKDFALSLLDHLATLHKMQPDQC